MTYDQWKSLIASVIATFGGMLTVWLASKGWVDGQQFSALLASPAFLGLATSIAMAVVAVVRRKQANMVATVAAMPEVARVVTVPTTAGADLAKATNAPGAVVTTSTGAKP